MSIAENYQRIRKEIPEHVSIIVAAKTRTVEELSEIIDAGATEIGENYVHEGQKAQEQLGEKAKKVRCLDHFCQQMKGCPTDYKMKQMEDEKF